MRFPLPTAVFPSFKVPADQSAQFAASCERIVDSTLDARREYIHQLHRCMDSGAWQRIKSHEQGEVTNLSVFQPRHVLKMPYPAVTATASPILIGVGELEGPLDDIMLGTTATTTEAMRVSTQFKHSDVVDARVLSRLDTVSDAGDPFAFLGFKWLVKAPSRKLVGMARARDFMFIESTGIRELPNGSRVGFQLMHSVAVATCPSLPLACGIVRAFFSFCFLFAEDPVTKRVELFCKGFVDPRGGLPQRLTVATATQVILDTAKAASCGRHIKLQRAFLTRNARTVSSVDAQQEQILRDSEETVTSEQSIDPIVGQPFGRLSVRESEDIRTACLACLLSDQGMQRRGRRRWRMDSRKASTCALCAHSLCRACSHHVQGVSTESGDAIVCSSCLDQIDAEDATSIARSIGDSRMRFQALRAVPDAVGCLDTRDREMIRLAPIKKRARVA